MIGRQTCRTPRPNQSPNVPPTFIIGYLGNKIDVWLKVRTVCTSHPTQGFWSSHSYICQKVTEGWCRHRGRGHLFYLNHFLGGHLSSYQAIHAIQTIHAIHLEM